MKRRADASGKGVAGLLLLPARVKSFQAGRLMISLGSARMGYDDFDDIRHHLFVLLRWLYHRFAAAAITTREPSAGCGRCKAISRVFLAHSGVGSMMFKGFISIFQDKPCRGFSDYTRIIARSVRCSPRHHYMPSRARGWSGGISPHSRASSIS